MIYRALFHSVLRWLPPEFAHQLGKISLKLAFRLGLLRAPAGQGEQIRGFGQLMFQNRLGIAAGFDKNADLVSELFALGFGHVEVGTVTARPQLGNPKPRLFRLVSSRSLINRMGFNNIGADEVANKLSKLRSSGVPLPVIGVNIGKSRITPVAEASADYAYSAARLSPFADYLAVNVSSPNTPGLRDLQQVDELKPILKAVLKDSGGIPVLVKLAPDMADEDVLAAASLVAKIGCAGLILANTTLSRFGLSGKKANEAGGLSGPDLAKRAIALLKLVRAKHPDLALISVGGVVSRNDFKERLSLGADLAQVYTAFVFEGPFLAKRWLS